MILHKCIQELRGLYLQLLTESSAKSRRIGVIAQSCFHSTRLGLRTSFTQTQSMQTAKGIVSEEFVVLCGDDGVAVVAEGDAYESIQGSKHSCEPVQLPIIKAQVKEIGNQRCILLVTHSVYKVTRSLSLA
jgi:hypothetical protein